MASAPPLDRAQYPILERPVGRHVASPLVYLDSVATALVPRAVTDAYARFLHTSCANIHRSAHTLAEEATDAYECAREHLAAFLGVDDPARVIFTHGATDALNLAALAWAECNLGAGDVVAVAEDNHHANIVPWQMLAERRGVEVAWIPLKADGRLDYGAWCAVAERGPKVVALCRRSNVLGPRQPELPRIMGDARRAGAVLVLDGAQEAGHEPVAADGLGADFYAVAAHKMGGPTGVGALLCSERVLPAMHPAIGGGGMVARVDRDGWTPAAAPAAFEAGTPPIAAAVAWDAALALLEEADLASIAAHTRALAASVRRELAALPGITVLGAAPAAPEDEGALISFTVEGAHPHDVGAALDSAGIMVRAGHHCARPLHAALGVRASVRASFAGYSTEEEARALVDVLACLTERRKEQPWA